MRRAFSLIELLVVIGIILVLAGLLIPVVGLLRDSARAADTAQRLDQITQGLAGLGGTSGRRAVDLIHEQVIAPHLRSQGFPTGVLRFVVSQETNLRYAIWNNAQPAATSLDGNYISTAAPQCLPFPWGQPALEDGTGRPNLPPYPFNLAKMSPTATVELMMLAEVDVDPVRWATDRGRQRPFNDAWGNPLVLAYAFFQPPRNTTITTRVMQVGGGLYTDIDKIRAVAFEDLFVSHAEQVYQFTKAVYLVPAAAGPALAQPLSGSGAPADRAADQTSIWQQAVGACQGTDWDETAWSRPPWQGVKQGKARYAGTTVRSFVGAPVVVK